jgi:hypothetical protein
MPAKRDSPTRALRRLPEATIRCASKASGPYSYAGLDQRQSGAASIAGWLIEKAFAGYSRPVLRPFSSFVVVRRTMVYSYATRTRNRRRSTAGSRRSRQASFGHVRTQIIPGLEYRRSSSWPRRFRAHLGDSRMPQFLFSRSAGFPAESESFPFRRR